ncbi:hypothetical protein D9H45_24605 [Escherichia coli]|nr:hypothetical protein [Escherichia coli]EFN7269070.1 hypothetical protein [Escherichia coli O21]EFN8407964.1 hypothetical protein [Escherichia coli O15]EEW2143643.1 hypothetical protein [Escherichia coli]EFD0494867.1 hypothetical protein [Escherichia coli]
MNCDKLGTKSELSNIIVRTRHCAGFFVCTTGKSTEPADLAELVKGAAQCSYRCGEAQWRASR